MPGQTGEQMMETCRNLPDVMWQGANGVLIEPDFEWKFAAEATLHCNQVDGDSWRVVKSPNNRWFKWYHYCVINGYHHFPPSKNDEVGVVLGVGDTITDAIDHLKENLEEVRDEQLHADTEGFVELLQEVHDAEEQGMEFTKQAVPEPKSVL
jgi:hypothetical protein